MSRVVIFVADLGDVIANTPSTGVGVRWGNSADCPALVAEGVNERWLSGVILNAELLVVAEEHGRIVGQNVFLTGVRVPQYSWLALRLQAHDVFSTGGFVAPDRRVGASSATSRGSRRTTFLRRGTGGWWA